MSYRAKALIKKMLSQDPNLRPTAQEVSDDDWFKETMQIHAKRHINLENVITKIKKTAYKKKVHNAIRLVSMIVEVSNNEMMKNMKQFTLTMN